MNSVIRLCDNIAELLGRGMSFIYTAKMRTHFKKAHGVHFYKPILVRGGEKISIGESTYFAPGLEICAWECNKGQTFSPNITIGRNCSFGKDNHISCINSIIIGDNCLTGRWVTISDNNHGESHDDLKIPPLDRKLVSKGPIVIGKNVWLGEKSTILGGVTIGDGAVIAANAVVTSDVPSFAVYGGIPAKAIKK